MTCIDATEDELMEALGHLARAARGPGRTRMVDRVLDGLLVLEWGACPASDPAHSPSAQ